MNILILGGGGREHALAWAIRKHPACGRLFCAPGNGGIAAQAECLAIDPCAAADVLAQVRALAIDLVVIGPEAPLAAGVSDALAGAGVAVFGPSRAAARLETSKSFAKAVCDAAGAPTAAWARFDALEPARAHLAGRQPPFVIKADGLAAGKGVVVAAQRDEAEAALRDMLGGAFGTAGAAVVIEDFLPGEEASLFVLADGTDAVVLGSAQDHKRAFDGDRGPNTGGMGAYAPAPVMTAEVESRAMAEIVRPVLAEMVRRGTPYRGVLYAGLMIADGAPRLVEFNARLGDPEAQVLALQAGAGLFDAILAVTGGRLGDFRPDWSPRPALGVVMAARGYPGRYATGEPIGGLQAAASVPGVTIFHAGTRIEAGRIVSAGGRVLTVCATADTLAEARDRAYAAVDRIDWPGGFCRRDIGWRALGS
ncbi:MAG: phosphoribosylamine--glycine ligase [Paracoccaceae bacterium]|nr:MAG: phosphoribosylamine--glycine ligase [Paracoccaceae bacterium]